MRGVGVHLLIGFVQLRAIDRIRGGGRDRTRRHVGQHLRRARCVGIATGGDQRQLIGAGTLHRTHRAVADVGVEVADIGGVLLHLLIGRVQL